MFLMLCVVLGVSSALPLDDQIGTFWHLTDVHFDPDYSIQGDVKKQCHYHGNTTGTLGFYGNYNCDSPLNLVKSALFEMKNIESKPDFILWTGDTVPHLDEKTVDDVYALINNVTTLLVQTFPGIPIVPLLGNHDAFPANQMPIAGKDNGYYRNVLEKGKWSTLLADKEREQFLLGGYYTRSLAHGVKLVVLNSNTWYSMNKLVVTVPDPNGQMAWLRKQLTDAQTHDQKVYIVAHICPGSFERLKDMSWFYPNFNKQYLQLVEEFSTTIVAHFCGHEHTDTFRLLKDGARHVTSVMFLSPAVTPWKSPLPGVGANNPGVRLYHYSYTAGQIKDYFQYYLNLTLANQEPGSAKWDEEYRATTAYNIPDCSAGSFMYVTSQFGEKSPAFRRYLRYNSVLYDLDPKCDNLCYCSQLCAIQYLHIDQYNQCIASCVLTPKPLPLIPTRPAPPPHTPRPPPPHKPRPLLRSLPRHMYIIVGIGSTIVLLAIVVSLICVNQRKSGNPIRYSRIVDPIN